MDYVKSGEQWESEYKGIHIEVKDIYFGGGVPHHKCGYIHIPKKIITRGYSKPANEGYSSIEGREGYSAKTRQIVYDLDIHGGVTYFEDYALGLVIGWDYAHWGDTYDSTSIEDVILDAHIAIDYFIDKFGLGTPCLAKDYYVTDGDN